MILVEQLLKVVPELHPVRYIDMEDDENIWQGTAEYTPSELFDCVIIKVECETNIIPHDTYTTQRAVMKIFI